MIRKTTSRLQQNNPQFQSKTFQNGVFFPQKTISIQHQSKMLKSIPVFHSYFSHSLVRSSPLKTNTRLLNDSTEVVIKNKSEKKHHQIPNVNTRRSIKLTEPEEFKFATDRLIHSRHRLPLTSTRLSVKHVEIEKRPEIPISLVDNYLKMQLRSESRTEDSKKRTVSNGTTTVPRSPFLRVNKRLPLKKVSLKVEHKPSSPKIAKFIRTSTRPISPKITKPKGIEKNKKQQLSNSKENTRNKIINTSICKTSIIRQLPRVASLIQRKKPEVEEKQPVLVQQRRQFTVPKPFELSTDRRQVEYQKKIDEKKERLSLVPVKLKQKTFPIVFIPKPSQKQLTTPHVPHLRLQERVKKRAEFDAYITEQERKKQLIREELNLQKEVILISVIFIPIGSTTKGNPTIEKRVRVPCHSSTQVCTNYNYEIGKRTYYSNVS